MNKYLRSGLWQLFFSLLILSSFLLVSATQGWSPGFSTGRYGGIGFTIGGLLGLILLGFCLVILVLSFSSTAQWWKYSTLTYILLFLPSLLVATESRAYAVGKLVFDFGVASLHDAWIAGTLVLLAGLVSLSVGAGRYVVGGDYYQVFFAVSAATVVFVFLPYLDYAVYQCTSPAECSESFAEASGSLAGCQNYFDETEACLDEAAVDSPDLDSCDVYDEPRQKNLCVTRVAELQDDPSICTSIIEESCAYPLDCTTKQECLETVGGQDQIVEATGYDRHAKAQASCGDLRDNLENVGSQYVNDSTCKHIQPYWVGGTLVNYTSLNTSDSWEDLRLTLRGNDNKFTYDFVTNSRPDNYTKGEFYAFAYGRYCPNNPLTFPLDDGESDTSWVTEIKHRPSCT